MKNFIISNNHITQIKRNIKKNKPAFFTFDFHNNQKSRFKMKTKENSFIKYKYKKYILSMLALSNKINNC